MHCFQLQTTANSCRMNTASCGRSLHLAGPGLGVRHQQHLRQTAAPCIWTAVDRSRAAVYCASTRQPRQPDSSSEDANRLKPPAVPAAAGSEAGSTRGSSSRATGRPNNSSNSNSSSSSKGRAPGKTKHSKVDQGFTGTEPPAKETNRTKSSQTRASTAANAGKSQLTGHEKGSKPPGSKAAGHAATIEGAAPGSSTRSRGSSSRGSSRGSSSGGRNSIDGSGSSGSSGSSSSIRSISSSSADSSRGSSRAPSPTPAVSSSRQGGHSQQQQPQHSKTARGHAEASNRQKTPQRGVQVKRLTEYIKAQQTPEDLLQLLQQHAADLKHIHISAAYNPAAKLCRNGVLPQQQPAAVQQLLQRLHQLAEQQRQQCGARELANIMWSCGRLQLPATTQLLLPEFLLAGKLQQAGPQEISNTLWAAATLDVQLTQGVVQQLVPRFMQVLPVTIAQDISNTLWAAATLGVHLPEGVVQQLMQRFLQVLQQANPQNVANSTYHSPPHAASLQLKN